MPVKQYNPTTAGRRHSSVDAFADRFASLAHPTTDCKVLLPP